MSDNTQLNSGSGGDSIRSIDRSTDSTPIAAKTQVTQMDVGGESNEALLVGVAKGTQATLNLPVVEMKDAGRTYVSFLLDATAGITTEALASMTINAGGTVTSATSYAVPTGKTLRITSMVATVKASATALAAGRVRLRTQAGALLATSPVLAAMDIPGFTGTYAANVGQSESVSFADGIEVPAGNTVGITHLETATTSTVSCCVTGFLY